MVVLFGCDLDSVLLEWLLATFAVFVVRLFDRCTDL